MINIEKGYSFRRQFSTREQKKVIVEEIKRLAEENELEIIFVGGTSILSYLLEKVKDPKKLRYQKDIDFFTQDPGKAIEILRENGYERRIDKYARHETQRKKKVGKIKLNIPEERDGKNVWEIDVYVGIDIISPHYYSRSFPDSMYAIESLIENATEKDFFGIRIPVQAIDDLIAMKLLNMERAFKGKEKVIYNRDVYDVLNLVNYWEEEISVNHLSKLVGGKDVLKKKLKLVIKEVERPNSEIDETLTKLMETQKIENLDASPSFLIGEKEEELKELKGFLRKL